MSPSPHGGVEVDELDERVVREAVDPVFEVVEGEAEVFALHELDDAAAHEVDGGDEHLNFLRRREAGGRRRGEAHGDAGGGEVLLEGARVGDAEVEDAGGEGGVGFAAGEDVGEVRGGAGAAGGDDGDVDGGG